MFISVLQLNKMSSKDILAELLPLYNKYTGIVHPYVDTVIDDIWQYEDGYKHVLWHLT